MRQKANSCSIRSDGRSKFFALVTVTAVLLWMPKIVPASQIVNHIRVAIDAMMNSRTPSVIRELLEENLAYYKSGAAGPDVLTNLTGQYDMFAYLPHYYRTGRLIENMFQLCHEEPSTIRRNQCLAYVLGWITHYYVDIYAHKLVNAYGGYYPDSPSRHKTLEMFEIAHVFEYTAYEYFNTNNTDLYVPSSHAFPIEVLNRAFGVTYSVDPESQYHGRAGWAGAFHGNAWNVTWDVTLAARVMQNFTVGTMREWRKQRMSESIESNVMGPIPFRDEYFRVINPISISINEISPDSAKRLVSANISWSLFDDSLTVSYISDWYEANQKASDAIVATLKSIAVDFCGSAEPNCGVDELVGRVALRLPDYSLDTGDPEGDEGEIAAAKLSADFKLIEELELMWWLISGDGQVLLEGRPENLPVQTVEPRGRRRYSQERTRSKKIEIELPERARHVNDAELQLKVALRVRNNNNTLFGNSPYATAFKFPARNDKRELRYEDVRKTKVPIEATDVKSFNPAKPVPTSSVSIEFRPGQSRQPHSLVDQPR